LIVTHYSLKKLKLVNKNKLPYFRAQWKMSKN
jgi:hypothetical protein